MFPSPFVLEGHELIDIHGPAIEETFVFRVDAFAEVVRERFLVSGMATGHKVFLV
jgi:hypothetical protein